MNIIVLSSAMIDEEFNQYTTIARIKPNPSNQNFYSKLIKALAYNNNVSVLSLRPFVKGSLLDTYLDARVAVDGMVHYYYPFQKITKLYKLFRQEKEILRVVDNIVQEQHYDNFVVVVDTLRYSLLKVAHKLRKKYGCKIIGVLTDNPQNLSGIRSSYVKSIKNNANNFDGYLALSEGLNKFFNLKKKPYYVFEGLVDDIEPVARLTIQNYFFFGGALYERYGVKRLVDAFHHSNSHYKLVIGGHGELVNYIENVARKDQRILFIGQVNKKELYGLEQNAYVNFNPRPYTIKLDKESVPSKLLEYFASGTPTITTMHTALHEKFYEDAIWLMDDSEHSFVKTIETIDDYDYKELKKSASTARLKVYEFYGLKNQGDAITHFLYDVTSSSNN